MIFAQTLDLIFDGSKSQTRRPALLYDELVLATEMGIEFMTVERYLTLPMPRRIVKVIRGGRLKFRLESSYSIQPGRGVKALGCYTLASIRCERLQSITVPDCIAEGCGWRDPATNAIRHGEEVIAAYRDIWTKLYAGTDLAWDKDPVVYPLGIGEVMRY